MLKIAFYCVVFTAASSLWSQVEPSAMGGGFSLDDTRMMTPPPVSRDAYPVVVGVESRSNHLDGGLVFTAAYVDNLVGTGTNKPISDGIYSFVPTIDLDRRSPRQGESLQYSAGFNLYQNTNQLNGVSQNGSADYRFHISPYAVVILSDTFWQNSNLYNQPNPFVGGGVSTGPGSSNSTLIAPYADQLQNFSSASINYQYGRNAMVGGNGSYTFSTFSNAAESQGLNGGDLAGAGAFYSRRLAPSQYIGVTYQFEKFVTHPVETYTTTHTVFGFYTHYFTKSFSLSILAGPEEYDSWSPTFVKQGHWIAAGQGSFGWQTLRTNLVASFTHNVSGAAGFIGAYHADMVSLSGRLQFSRTWNIGVNGNYSFLNPVNSEPTVSGPGGHTITGGADLQHGITERINAAVGYQRFHESYANIPAVSSFPDSNRVYVSLSYGFHRPLGR
jgi:hypothetical protein